MTKTDKRHDARPIGTDISDDMHHLRVLCARHSGGHTGTLLYPGDEWGGWDLPACERCGRVLDALMLVTPAEE